MRRPAGRLTDAECFLRRAQFSAAARNRNRPLAVQLNCRFSFAGNDFAVLKGSVVLVSRPVADTSTLEDEKVVVQSQLQFGISAGEMPPSPRGRCL